MNNKTQNMETNENANPQLANENKIKNNLGEQLLSEVIEKETKVEVPNEVKATDVKVQSKNAQFSPIAEEFEKLKRDVAKNEFVEEIENEIPNATGMELLNDDVEEIPKLVDPILQRVGLASFIGSSDVGKSSLLRHLCICVVFGLKFLYWEVKALYHRAIYVSTEDDRTSISSLLKKQNKDYGLIPEDLEGLLFIFETDNLLERLERELKKQPVDLIVIDAFADIFSAELYKTNEVRAFLNQYNQLAQKYGCLIIFLHHTRKSSEELMPSKNNSLGSQGYEAKMRFMAEVKSNVQFPDKKHFCIVKGNYLSNDFKTKSFDFEFTENLTFNSLNTRTPFEKLNSKEESFETLEAEYNEIMSLLDKGLKYRDIALKFGVSHTTIYRKVRKFEKIRSSNNQEEN